MMRMCMMIFYTFKEMNNVVCVGFFMNTLEEIYMTRYRGLSFQNSESSTQMVAFLDYPHRWR